MFSSRARTAESYLAGLGASGALMAGALVVFLILVGTVTFDAWPRAVGLIEDGAAKVAGAIGIGGTDESASDQSPAPAASPAKPDRASDNAGGRQQSPDSTAPGGRQGTGRAPAGNVPSAGNGGGGGSGSGTQQQQSGSSGSPSSSSGPLRQTIQNTTTALNTTVNNTTTTLNNTVSGLTNTLDETVSGLLGGK
jgi:hypothetical protein